MVFKENIIFIQRLINFISLSLQAVQGRGKMLETRLPRMTLQALLVVAVVAVTCEAVIKYPPMMTKQPPSNEELLFQVASRMDENDKPFIIECEAEGEPAPK